MLRKLSSESSAKTIPKEVSFWQRTGERILPGLKRTEVLRPAVRKFRELMDTAAEMVNPCEETEDTAITEKIRTTVANSISAAITFGRKARLIGRLNIATLPQLIDDEDEDKVLKQDILEHIGSKINQESSFHDQTRLIANSCFDKGISPDKVIAILESDEILKLTINRVLDAPHSKHRGDDLVTFVDSAITSAILKTEFFVKESKKPPLNKENEEKVVEYIEYFRENYDPQDPAYTLSAFIERIEKEFEKEQIHSWLKEHVHLLIEIVRLKPENKQTRTKEARHIKNMIETHYEQRAKEMIKRDAQTPEGKDGIEQFITCYFDRCIKIKALPDEPQTWEIDLNKIQEFFADTMAPLKSRKVGDLRIRKLMINTCTQKANKDGAPVEIILKDKEKTYKKTINEDPVVFYQEITEIINEHTHHLSSTSDMANFLANPKRLPETLEQDYKNFFDENGELKRKEYNKFLRKLFGIFAEKEGTEHVNKAKSRIRNTYKVVNELINKAYEELKLPNNLDYEEIRETNDYAALLKIACETEDPKLRFAARRKIELGWITFKTKYSRPYVLSKKEEYKLRDTLESDDLIVTGPQTEIKFAERINSAGNNDTDIPVQDVIILKESETSLKALGYEEKSIPIIPVIFGGIECYTLAEKNDDKKPTDRYLGRKSLISAIIKTIRGEKNRPSDITDFLRMTFVAKSIKDIPEITQHIEKYYSSFGRVIKIEDRYGEMIRTSALNIDPNESKSENYKSVRYVVEILIKSSDGKEYLAPFEIRILLPEDLIKENSNNSDASHPAYELRRFKEIMLKIAPKEISPEIYTTDKPNPKDIFQKTKEKLAA